MITGTSRGETFSEISANFAAKFRCEFSPDVYERKFGEMNSSVWTAKFPETTLAKFRGLGELVTKFHRLFLDVWRISWPGKEFVKHRREFSPVKIQMNSTVHCNVHSYSDATC
jgi:hypothetical protein